MLLPVTADGDVEIDGRRVRVTSLDRVLWPDERFRKRDLIAYYGEVAEVMLPHLAGRPLTLGRFPGGVAARGFLQNECRGAPAWMRTAPLRLQTGSVRRYCVVDDRASLVWIANLGTIEVHPYLFRADEPELAAAVLFDLDPGPGTSLLDTARVALRLRTQLAADGLDAAVKTSGAAGIHAAVPVEDVSLAQARQFARVTAQQLHEAEPLLVADPAAYARRPGRVLIDWRQNDDRRSTVAPYSLRATLPLGASTPLDWDELAAAVRTGDERRLRFTPPMLLERIAREGDLFAVPAQRLAL